MKHKGWRTKKIHQKTCKMFFLSYICSLKRQRPVKRMAEIRSRFLRAAIARWTLAGVVFPYPSTIFQPSDNKRFTEGGMKQGRRWCCLATELRRLGKNKFIEPAAPPLHRLPLAGQIRNIGGETTRHPRIEWQNEEGSARGQHS